VKLPPDQLDALVAPIALYPDPLLAQTLAASTYPLEIIQLQQWMAKHKDLKDKALADAVKKQPWDPAIQSMAAVPEVVKRLADDVQWTTDLGNAFLSQQTDVMDSVQRMRKKAKDKGALASNEQQKVETKVIEEKTVIIVESANPEVIYVPSYSPTVVYGPPIYPYPPIYYPPYPPGAAFVSFTVGVMWGAAIWGGSCCGCGWGGSGNVYINHNNNFYGGAGGAGGVGGVGGAGGVGGVGGAGGVGGVGGAGGVGGVGGAGKPGGVGGPGGAGKPGGVGGPGGAGGGNWQHNPSHRGAAPYGDKATANKFGGGQSGRGGGPSAGQQPAGGGNRGGGGPSAGQQPAGGGSRGGGAGPSTSNRGASGGGSRGGSQIGNQSVPKSSSSRSGGFGGGSGGYSGSSARSSSSRGSSSMGSRGGGSRGGGGGRRR
jgi:hypothetical protein